MDVLPIIQKRWALRALIITACVAAALPVLMTTAGAQTPEDDSYTSEQVDACADDAFRLCSDAIPNVSRVRQCMMDKKAFLSQKCKALFK